MPGRIPVSLCLFARSLSFSLGRLVMDGRHGATQGGTAPVTVAPSLSLSLSFSGGCRGGVDEEPEEHTPLFAFFRKIRGFVPSPFFKKKFLF